MRLIQTLNDIEWLKATNAAPLPPIIRKEYFWMKGKGPSSIEVAEAPQWMIDLMTEKKPKEQKKSNPKSTNQPNEAEAVLERLASKCPLFEKAERTTSARHQ